MRIILTTILVSALLGGGGVYAWRYFGGFSGEEQEAIAFIDAYGAYADVAGQVDALVHRPGSEGNTDRSELLTLLSSILTERMDAVRREELARLAFNNLTALKKEIDGAQAAQARLYEGLQQLDAASRIFKSIARQRDAADIVRLARERAELTARITAILSEINDHTYAIITKILSDGGELTQEHIQAINATTAGAEERFETLTGVYDALGAKQKTLEAEVTAFAQSAL
jgi:hypothetical protein